MLSDLSPSMPPGWQAIDIMTRAGKTALRSKDFQKSPSVVAVVQSVVDTLNELVSAYVKGTGGGGGASTAESTVPTQGESQSSDADAQPAAPDDGGDTGGDDAS